MANVVFINDRFKDCMHEKIILVPYFTYFHDYLIRICFFVALELA